MEAPEVDEDDDGDKHGRRRHRPEPLSMNGDEERNGAGLNSVTSVTSSSASIILGMPVASMTARQESCDGLVEADSVVQGVMPLFAELLQKLEQRLIQEMESIKALIPAPQVAFGGRSNLSVQERSSCCDNRSSCNESIISKRVFSSMEDAGSEVSENSTRQLRPKDKDKDKAVTLDLPRSSMPSQPPPQKSFFRRVSMASSSVAPVGLGTAALGHRKSVVSASSGAHMSLAKLLTHVDECTLSTPKGTRHDMTTPSGKRPETITASLESSLGVGKLCDWQEKSSLTQSVDFKPTGSTASDQRMQVPALTRQASRMSQLTKLSQLTSIESATTAEDSEMDEPGFGAGVTHGTPEKSTSLTRWLREMFWKSPQKLRSTTSIFDGVNNVTKLETMRATRHQQVLERDQASVTSEIANTCAPTWLYFVGILQWSKVCRVVGDSDTGLIPMCCRNLNRLPVLLLLVGAIAHFVFQLHSEVDLSHVDDAISWEDLIPPLLIMAIGCLIRLFCIIFFDEAIVGSPQACLTNHIASIGFASLWKAATNRDMVKILSCWVCIVAASIYISVGWKLDAWHAATNVGFLAFTTHMFLAVAYSMVYICRGLLLSIDSFVQKVLETGTFDEALANWRVLDAVLRKACITVGRSFIMLLTIALAAIFVPVILGSSTIALVPGAVALLIVLWVAFRIGEISSFCDKVPSFINMLTFAEDDFDQRRQYVVDYINNSRAGFYMFEVRVTGEMVVKCAYVGGVLAIGFATQILHNG